MFVILTRNDKKLRKNIFVKNPFSGALSAPIMRPCQWMPDRFQFV